MLNLETNWQTKGLEPEELVYFVKGCLKGLYIFTTLSNLWRGKFKAVPRSHKAVGKGSRRLRYLSHELQT